VAVAAGVIQEADADASLREVLAAALEANERLARLAEDLRAENTRLREENARLREELARRDAQIEQMAAELAVLKRLVFGRSSERRGRRRQAGMRTAAWARAGSAGAVRVAGCAGPGRGPGGGITRICPGSR